MRLVVQNGMLGTDIVISKEDYFSLLEICNEQDLRCTPFILGFNAVQYDYTEDEEEPEVRYSWLEGFDAIDDEYLRVILEWDEDDADGEIIEFTWNPDQEEGDEDDEEEIWKIASRRIYLALGACSV